MSKLYEKYLLLKKQDSSTLYLFRSGIFYMFLDEDAKKMSSFLHLKLMNLNETILKCSFPVNSLDKYTSLIKNAGYKMNIVDASSQETYPSTDYILNTKVKTFIKDLSCIDANCLSIREAYSFIEKTSQQAKDFIKEMKI